MNTKNSEISSTDMGPFEGNPSIRVINPVKALCIPAEIVKDSRLSLGAKYIFGLLDYVDRTLDGNAVLNEINSHLPDPSRYTLDEVNAFIQELYDCGVCRYQP